MYHSAISGVRPWGLPLSQKVLPQYFSEAGYGNMYHMGKWHLVSIACCVCHILRGVGCDIEYCAVSVLLSFSCVEFSFMHSA
jgi:hypothetical protein